MQSLPLVIVAGYDAYGLSGEMLASVKSVCAPVVSGLASISRPEKRVEEWGGG